MKYLIYTYNMFQSLKYKGLIIISRSDIISPSIVQLKLQRRFFQ